MRSPNRRDSGSVLPLVLVVVLIMAVVVVAIADYATTTLRFGQIVEGRTDRVSASQAAMDDAIEQLQLQRGLSICATAAGSGAGASNPFPEQINGADASVTCQLTTADTSSSQGFALAITGEGVNVGAPTLELRTGGQPTINGPVYVHDPSRIDLQRPTTIVEGDLWYEDPTSADTCAIADPASHVAGTTAFQRTTDVSVNQLLFDPPLTRGYYCINRSWDQMFGEPDLDPALATLAPAPAPAPDADGNCLVFEPGYYDATNRPVLADNNYFRSGVYHFDDIGSLVFDKQVATFGNSAVQGFPIVANDECDDVRTVDSVDGATVYTSGDTSFDMDKADTGLEIAGRLQGSEIVALHVLSTSLDPNIDGLIVTGNGAKREVALNGLLWAPESALIFDTIPTKKAAALRGGAVIARLTGSVSAAATGFVIEIPTSSASTSLRLVATAENSQGASDTRVVVDYRPSTGEVAIRSWRVCGIADC